MKKYMGNKSKILDKIFAEAQEFCPEADTIFDAFSGTTNVGRFFKQRGYSVVSNDVNTTSFLLGEVYLKTNELPSFDLLFRSNCKVIKSISHLKDSGELSNYIKKLIDLNHNTNSKVYLESIADTHAMQLLAYLSFAALPSDCEDSLYTYTLKASDFVWRNFCFDGTNSEYFNLVSQKSLNAQIDALSHTKLAKKTIIEIQALLKSIYTPPYNIEALETAISKLEQEVLPDTKVLAIIKKLEALNRRQNHIGRRMFFSEIHGHRIDTLNNLNLLWLRSDLIDYKEYYYLQCALVEAIALFSNTSATYQAFYKTYRENTKQVFRLVVPEISYSPKKQHVLCGDTFELIDRIKPEYELLYLDPPYNWRIYDSNYHLLNLIADFCNVADDILNYEVGIAGAAGENRNLTRNYTNYNKRETFEDLLFKLIIKAKCRYIIISYSDSLSNHNKNSLSSVQRIEDFLKDPEFFIPEKYKKIEVRSLNFESRKNEQKDNIHELLFVAMKKEE